MKKPKLARIYYFIRAWTHFKYLMISALNRMGSITFLSLILAITLAGNVRRSSKRQIKVEWRVFERQSPDRKRELLSSFQAAWTNKWLWLKISATKIWEHWSYKCELYLGNDQWPVRTTGLVWTFSCLTSSSWSYLYSCGLQTISCYVLNQFCHFPCEITLVKGATPRAWQELTWNGSQESCQFFLSG